MAALAAIPWLGFVIAACLALGAVSIMSLWMLSVTFGNLRVLLADAGIRAGAVTDWITATGLGENAFLMFFFAASAAAAALAFALYAQCYPMQDFYRA
ncbi:MAG: hypothetical protein ACREPZ_07625 [Rhodanobacteraceae bacterium]